MLTNEPDPSQAKILVPPKPTPMEAFDYLVKHIAQLESQLAAARATVEKLFLTADGVRVVPGVTLWRNSHDGRTYTVFVSHISQTTVFDERDSPHCPDYLYSKESLAVAAREAAVLAAVAAAEGAGAV